MKVRLFFAFLLLVVIISSCTRKSDTLSETSPFVSENEFAISFLDTFNGFGFSGSITEKNIKAIAQNIRFADGKSLFDDGLFFESEDLYGTGYGYGENSNCISYNYEIDGMNKVEEYALYGTKKLDGAAIPNNLAFDSSFKEALQSFSILDRFNSKNDGVTRNIECFSNNGEELYVYLEGWHGEIIDNKIDTATATIRFNKTLSNIKLNCVLGFSQGKLKFVNYTLTKTTPTDKKYEANEISMKFYKKIISNSKYEADINSIVFKDDEAELTITAKSQTGNIEDGKITLYGWLSADNGMTIGEYDFIAGKNIKKLKLKPKADANIDYFNTNIDCDELGIYLYQGKIRFNRSMSR